MKYGMYGLKEERMEQDNHHWTCRCYNCRHLPMIDPNDRLSLEENVNIIKDIANKWRDTWNVQPS